MDANTYVHPYIHAYVHVSLYVCAYIHTSMLTYVFCGNVDVYANAHVYVQLYDIYIYIYIYISCSGACVHNGARQAGRQPKGSYVPIEQNAGLL